MSVFTTEQQTSAYAKDPEYYRGSGFMLGLMGYRRNGQKSTFGKIKDVALPVIGGIAGTLIAGPAGAAVGSALGQGLNAASNRVASAMVAGAEDSEAAIDSDLTGTLARGQLGMSLGSMAGDVSQAGIKSGDSLLEMGKKLGPALTDNLGGVASGLAGAVAASGQPAAPRQRIRYYREGGESTPGEASPGFARRFAEERSRQGAGGRFLYQGKEYNTYFREEVNPATQMPLADVARAQPGFQDGEVPAIPAVDLSSIKRKAGVKLDGLNNTIAGYLSTLPDALKKQVLATSGVDSFDVHKRNSLHKTGDALDLRYHPELYAYIQSDPVAHQLGLSVLDPNHGTAPHIHLQYKPGRQFAEGGEAGPVKPKPAERPADLLHDPAHTLEMYRRKQLTKMFTQFGASPDDPALKRLMSLQQIAGNPKIQIIDTADAAKSMAGEGERAFYRWGQDTMFVPKGDFQMKYLAELPHAYQRNNKGISQYGEPSATALDPSSPTFRNDYDKTEYNRQGSVEQQAHQVIQPDFERTVKEIVPAAVAPGVTKTIDEYMTPEIKKRYLARLYHGNLNGWVNTYPEYREGGELRPYTFNHAGMKFSIEAPTDYKVYDKGDKTEDIQLVVDGKPWGGMRMGERIFDQMSNLAMKAIMRSDYSPEQKQQALGEHIYQELSTHKNMDDDSREFTNGNEVTPKPPKRYTSEKVLADLRAHNERLIDKYERDATDQSNAYFKKAADPRAKAIVEQARGTLAAMDRGEINYDPATHRLVNRTNQRNYDLNRLGGLYNETGFSTNYGAGVINLSGGAVNGVAPTPATPSKTAKPAPVATVGSGIIGRGAVAAVGAAAGKPVATAAGKPAATGAAAPTTTKPAAATKPTATDAQVSRFVKNFVMPETDTVGALPAVPGGTGMSTKPVIDHRVAQSFDEELSRTPGTNWEPTKEVTKPVDTKTLTGNLLDLGRVVTGAVMAAKPLPTYQQPAALTAYQGEVAAKKNEGYSAPEWNTINGQIADNYSAGVNAITSTFGGGTSAGVALSALNRLNLTRGQQTQAAMTGDVSRRAQNFAMYGSVVGQQAALDRQLYEEQAARVGADKQAGAALAQSGLQNIEQRQIYNENYGADSGYKRLMDAQVERETEATNLLRKMRAKYV